MRVHACVERSGLKLVSPPIDYPLYGLDAAWRGPRWLSDVQSGADAGICEVTLSHGDRRVPMRGHSYLDITSRSAASAQDDKHGRDSVRELAWLGLF
jgi:hypothetical protein